MTRHEEATGYRGQQELELEAGAARTDAESRSTLAVPSWEQVDRIAGRLEAALDRAEISAARIRELLS